MAEKRDEEVMREARITAREGACAPPKKIFAAVLLVKML
jgi:hypothetical protein